MTLTRHQICSRYYFEDTYPSKTRYFPIRLSPMIVLMFSSVFDRPYSCSEYPASNLNTLQKYAKYSAALDAIEQNAPELVPHILSGAYKISFENIVALSEMEPEELKALSKKIGKNPYAFARYSESRRCLYSDASAKPGTAAAEQPAIKTMPAYDPDAEVAGLTLTIPSWMSSIDRTKSMAHLEAISPAARQNLLAALTELEGKIQEMLNAIEGES